MPGSLSTVQPDYLARLREIHRQLGIPADYLENTHLPLCEEPAELVLTEPDYYQRPQQLIPAADHAWRKMRRAAGEEGIELFLISAFRSVAYQTRLIEKQLAGGRAMTDLLKVVAAPGFSEHHTGRAVDLGTSNCPALQEEFENTVAFQWLGTRAAAFGFVLSYPRGNSCGISYEPWHWCFQL